MIQNDNFKFVVHKENFLSLSQCQKLMRYLETGEATESELAGNYDENILNKEVRDNKEVTINNEKLNNKLKMVFELSNLSIWKYNIQEMEKVKIDITDKSGKNYTAPRTRGSIIIFPAFLSHRVTPVTKGRRYSLITWMNGDCFV